MIDTGRIMVRDTEPTAPDLSIDLAAVSEAARVLDGLSADLAAARTQIETQVLDGLAALPPSDLFNAFAFAWGRWSRVLDESATSIGVLASTAGRAVVAVEVTDDEAADRIRPL